MRAARSALARSISVASSIACTPVAAMTFAAWTMPFLAAAFLRRGQLPGMSGRADRVGRAMRLHGRHHPADVAHVGGADHRDASLEFERHDLIAQRGVTSRHADLAVGRGDIVRPSASPGSSARTHGPCRRTAAGRAVRSRRASPAPSGVLPNRFDRALMSFMSTEVSVINAAPSRDLLHPLDELCTSSGSSRARMR